MRQFFTRVLQFIGWMPQINGPQFSAKRADRRRRARQLAKEYITYERQGWV